MTKGKQAPTSRAVAASAAPQSVNDVLHQIEEIKTNPEVLTTIANLYERFLAHQSVSGIVGTLDELHAAEFLQSHVWRVRTTALDAKATTDATRQAWLVTVLLLVSHGMRRAESADDATAVWAFIGDDTAAWHSFMATVTTVPTAKWTLREKAALGQFFICCFASLDVEAVAAECVKLVSLAMWAAALSPSQRAIAFEEHPKLARHWKKLKLDDEKDDKEATTPAKKKRKTEQKHEAVVTVQEKTFVPRLVQEFADVLTRTDVKQLKKTGGGDDELRYIALVLTLVTDLLSLLPTRRFLEVVVRRKHVLAQLRQSSLVQWFLESRSSAEGAALTKQIERLEHVLHFPIDAHTGKSLTTLQDRKEASTHKVQALQLAAFSANYRDTPVETLAVVPVAAIVDRVQFKEHLGTIGAADRRGLEELGVALGIFGDAREAETLSTALLTDYFADEFSAVPHSAVGGDRAVLPTELDIWSDSLVVENDSAEASPVYGTGKSVLFPVLPLPKLGLQYLNVTDFLERGAVLGQVDTAHAVRRDLESAIRPLDAIRSIARNGETVFRGFSPMAVPLQTAFSILKVEKPKIGEITPAAVVAQFDIELDSRHDITAFDRYQHREVVYLVTIRPTRDEAHEAIGFADDATGLSGHFAEDYGVLYVRCAELTAIEDEEGNQVKHSGEDGASGGRGRKRTMTVALNGAQYKRDLEEGQFGAYEYVNLLVRRDPRTNNFKAVLDTTRSMLHNAAREMPDGTVPAWLYDLFLGYGDPSSASFEEIAKSKLQATVTIPLHHALGDGAHAVDSCSPDSKHHVKLVDADHDDKALDPKDAVGPYTLVTDVATKTSVLKAHRKAATTEPSAASALPTLTQEQTQVVIRGTAEGLTLAAGATGTGKTKSLVALIQNLYQDHGVDEKILVVARSTTILDKLLDRLKPLPFVDEANIVRLGAQRKDGGDDFSSQGRVDFLLQRRIDFLHEVDTMAKWMERTDAAKFLGISASASYSCENALFFYRFHMKALFDDAKQAKAVKDSLLHQYFTERTGSEAKSLCELQTFAARLEGMYGELHRLQPFELLQMPAQRRDVYLMQHARVIATTSLHAALQFQKLVDLKLRWTSVIVEDAAQLTEVDTLIPLALACRSNAVHNHKLKRLVMVGDSSQHALVEVASLKSYAQGHISLFGRLLRLGAPHTRLSPLPIKSKPQPPKAKPTPPPKAKPVPPPKKTASKK